MKDKFGLTKIQNPYKIFLRNIQLGIFIILFLFGSLFAGNAIYNKANNNVLAAAAYKCTITLNKNGGSGGTSTIYVKEDGKLGGAKGYWLDSSCSSKRIRTNQNALTTPTRTGYTFKGYYTQISGGEERITADGYLSKKTPKSNKVDSNQTWYARWEPITYTIYVKYHLDLGEYGATNADGDNISYTFSSYSQTINLTDCIEDMSETALVFDHWQASSSYVYFSSKTQLVIPANTYGGFTITGYYKPITYTISYDYNGGTYSGTQPTTIGYFNKFSVSAPTRTGYLFQGWSLSNLKYSSTLSVVCQPEYSTDGTNFSDINSSNYVSTLSSNIYFRYLNVYGGTVTLKAIYTPTYTVNFEKDGEIYKTQEMLYGHQYFVSEPTKTAYNFTGWTARNLSSTAKYQATSSSSFVEYTGTTAVKIRQVENLCSTAGGTVTLVANFSPITYNVSLNTSPNVYSSISCTYDSVFSIEAPTNSNGAKFLGWKVTGYSSLDTVYDLNNAYYGKLINALSRWRIASSGKLTDTIVSPDYKYFKNLTTRQGATIYLTAQWDTIVNYSILDDTYSERKVSLGISYYGTIITNKVNSTYYGYTVLGVFSKSDFSVGSILWVPTSSSPSYTCLSSSGTTYYYVLLDNTCKSEGEWDSKNNNNRYELKINFLKEVSSSLLPTTQEIYFKIANTEFSGSGIVSLKNTTINFRLGKKYNFDNYFDSNSGLSNDNYYIKETYKKIRIGWDYLDATNIYFFMDTSQNLWVWDGEKSVSTGITLSALSGNNRKEGKTVSAAYIAEFYDNQYFKEKDEDDNSEKNVFYINAYNCWPDLASLDYKGFFYEMKEVGLTYTVKLMNNITETIYSACTFGSKENYPFTGTFDGNGKTLSEVYTLGGDFSAVFGIVNGGTIKNLKIKQASIHGGTSLLEGTQCASALVNKAINGATIKDVSVDKITLNFTGSSYCRNNNGYRSGFGLIGYLDNSNVYNCSVDDFSYTGNQGYTANLFGETEYYKWYKHWDQTYGNFGEYGVSVGGIVGYQNSGTVDSCSVNTFSYNGGGVYIQVGGIVGKCLDGTISNCTVGDSYNSEFYAKVTPYAQKNTFVGGIVGKLGGEVGDDDEIVSGTVTNCKNLYSLMAVYFESADDLNTGTDFFHLGGIAGGVFRGTISNSFNLSSLFAIIECKDQYITGILGGIVGLIYCASYKNGVTSATITNCYSISKFDITYGAAGADSDREAAHVIGGIVGKVLETKGKTTTVNISNCYSIYHCYYEPYSSKYYYVRPGGICGYIDYNKSGTINLSNCYFASTPNVTKLTYTGSSVFDTNINGNGIINYSNVSLVYNSSTSMDETSDENLKKQTPKEFVQTINGSHTSGSEVIFGFNPNFQDGLPFLVNVGNKTKIFRLWNCINKLRDESMVYRPKSQNCYLGFSLTEAYGLYSWETEKWFDLSSCSTTSDNQIFIGYGEGSSSSGVTVCGNPDLSTEKFTNNKRAISSDAFPNNDVVDLVALFANCASIVSNINLIDGNITTDPSKTKITVDDDNNHFIFEYDRKENNLYYYKFYNTKSSSALTWENLESTLHASIGAIEDLGLNVALSSTNIFGSDCAFTYAHASNKLANKDKTSALNCNGSYYCYGYTNSISLNVISPTLDGDSGALTGWEYRSASTTGILVYGVEVTFKAFGEYNGESDVNTTFADYQISRKGFTLQEKEPTSVFASKDSGSSATGYKLQSSGLEIFTKEGSALYAVYNSGPSVEVIYHDENGAKLYSENLPGKKYGTVYSFGFTSSKYINCDEVNFAGWWGKNNLSEDRIRANINYRVNASTTYINTSSGPTLHLYKKVVKTDLNIDEDYRPSQDENDNYYQIETAEDLVWISNLINKGTKDVNFKLMNDIDLSGYNFYPISADSTNVFTGIFDGQGYSIKNLELSSNVLLQRYSFRWKNTGSDFGYETIKAKAASNYTETTSATETNGLFAYSNGTIKNVNILSATISHQVACTTIIGGVVGNNTGVISNVVVDSKIEDTVSSTYSVTIGGIAGKNSSKIQECVAKTNLIIVYSSSSKKVGLIAGLNENTVTDSFAIPAENGTSDLIGSGDFTRCYLQANIPALSSLNDLWTQEDYINGGKPYLRNTGINKVEFINTIPENCYNGTNNIARINETNKKLTITKDFFILDDYSGLYNKTLRYFFANKETTTNSYNYSGFNFSGYSEKEEIVLPYLTSNTSTYKDETKNVLNLFKKGTYYAIWTPKEYSICVEDTTLRTFEFGAGEKEDFEDLFEDIFNKYKQQMSQNYQDIDYLEFTFKGQKYYVDRNGDFVTVANNKITSATTHNNISNFFPYMYDQDITFTPHFYNISYKIYIDVNGGEWKNLPAEIDVDKDNRISTSGNGNDDVLFGGLAISQSATGNKLTDLADNNKDSKYLYKKGYHVVGFSYLDETSLTDIAKFKDINLSYMEIEGKTDNPEDIYNNVHYVVLFAVYEPNQYEVTYVAKNNIETENFAEDFNTTLKTQTFVYGQETDIYSGSTPNIEGYKFVGYEFTYNSITYYLNEDAEFIDETGKKITVEIEGESISTFTPYIYLEDLTIYCIFERLDIEITLTGLNGIRLYYEIYDLFSQDLKNCDIIYGNDKIKVKYGDSFKARFYVEHGTKVNYITLNGSQIFSAQNYINNSSKYASEFNKQNFEISNIIQSQTVEFSCEQLKTNSNENLNQVDGVYLIENASDLYTFFTNYNSGKAKLTNNINLAGYVFSVDNFSGELDGDNFTISGFVISNALNNNYGFIKNLTGTLKNVNFDNVILNINSYLFDIDYKTIWESDENITSANISVVATNNNGKIENVYVLGGQFNVKNSITDNNVINIGLISVNNNGSISNSCSEVEISIDNNKRTLAVAGIATYNTGEIKKSYFEGTITCNAGTVKGIVVNGEEKVSASYANYFKNEEKTSEIVRKDNDDNNSVFIEIGNTTKLVGVNNTIVHFSHNYSQDTNENGLTTYLNSNKINNSYNITTLYKLNNSVIFNTTNNVQTNKVNFSISMKTTTNVSNNFTTKNIETEEEITSKKIEYILPNYSEELTYNLISTPNAWDSLDLKFFIDENSMFDETKISKILESVVLKVTVNGETHDNIVIADYFNKITENGTYGYSEILTESILYYVLNNENISLKFNDEVKIELKLPAWARLGTNLGVKVNENEKIAYRGEREFEYEFTIKEQAEKIWFYVERNVLTLTINLNKDELLESEKQYIKFNPEFYSNKSDYEYDANTESVTITIYPVMQDNEFVYFAPDISDMLAYDKLGINYNFKGLYEYANGELTYLIYDENYACIINFERDYNVYIKWEAVKYSIMMVYDDTMRYSSYNGFSQTNSYMVKTVSFGDKLTDDNGISVEIPYAIKLLYSYAYKLEGLNIIENDGTMYALTLNEDGNPILMDEYFSRTWTNYRNGTMNGLPKVRLEPVFSEIEFEVLVKAEGTIFTTKGNVSSSGGTFENGEQSFTLGMTISKYLEMRQNNFSEIPVPSFEHYDFNGYYATSPSLILLTYSSLNSCYNERECEELLSNITLYSAYNTTFVDVIIHATDLYTQNNTAFNITAFNDIKNYESFDGGIKFSLEYNSTNVTLPTIEIVSTDYLFNKYYVNDEVYTKNFVFTQATDIYLVCDYKVTLKTFGASLSSEVFEEETANQVYKSYFTSPLISSSQVTLPNLTLESYTLQGYKVSGQTQIYSVGENVNVTKPLTIEAVWAGNIVNVSLDGNGAKLPTSIASFTGLMGYSLTDETHAEIKVIHNTQGSVLAGVLPTLHCVGKTFEKYVIEDTTTDLSLYSFDYNANQNVNVIAKFIDNIYTIQIIENNLIADEITASYNETITSTFAPSLSNLTYCGLSLHENYLRLFEMPSTMPYLEDEFENYVTISSNNVLLKVYAFYLSNVTVQIEANINAKISNTTGLNEFSGGNDFGNPANFKLTVENILHLDFTLPIPEVRNELEYSNFMGYYGYNENDEFVQMADANGNLTNKFIIKDNIALTLMFEEQGYDLVLTGDYSTVVSEGAFEQNGTQFIKHVNFGETIESLPVLELTNYIFKGFYFSKNTENILNDIDVQLSDENGNLVSGYESFSMAYVNKLNETGVSIIAKYEQAYITINISTNNSNLGIVYVPKNEQGEMFEYTQTETGYSCRIPSGTSIMISALEQTGGKFDKWTVDKSYEIISESEKETMVLMITEDISIVANFNYIDYKINYFLNDEQLLNVTPDTFHIDETVALPNIEIEGYEFLGWYKEKTLVTPITSISENTARDVTVYAKVRNKEITVNIYSSLDNYTAAQSINVSYNMKLEVLKDYIVNTESSYLVGLFTEKDGEGIAINENSLCVFNEDFDLYAYYISKFENTLKGSGLQANPYKISSESDLITFANLINADLHNLETTYFELTNNIEINLSNLLTIGNGVRTNFKANFNGANYVIYIKGENFNSNFVYAENGNIETYNGLFGINNGTISNLVVVSDIILSENYDSTYSQLVGSICAVNNGVISNCIAYSKIIDNTTNTATTGVVSAKNYGEETLNTTIQVSNDEAQYLTENENHYHKNNVTKPAISNNSYYIYSESDLAWLSIQSKIDYDVYLMNNLDMKGKIINEIKLNSNFYGNGYTISNLLIIDETSFINTIKEECCISKVNFENLALFNLISNVSLIEENNGTIEKVLVSGITNGALLVNQNNATIQNVYSVSSNNSYNVVNVNNSEIQNSYAYLNNFVVTQNGTIGNVYNMNNDNYSEILNLIETNFDINTDSSVWIVDENCVMFGIKLPVLKGVGNIYLKITAPNEFVIITATPFSPINNVLLLKTVEDITLNFELTESYLSVKTLKLNNINIMENKIGDNIYIRSLYLIIENELIVELTKNAVNIKLSVENSLYGDIKYNETLYKTLNLEVEYGTEINFEAIASLGYKFASWSDDVTTISRTITANQDLVLVASFSKIYKVEVYYNATNVTCVDKHSNFVETDYGLVGTFDTTEFEDFENLYPVLTRPNYILSGFNIIKMSDKTTVKMNAKWEIDYISVNIVTDVENYKTSLTSSTEAENINVIATLAKNSYSILRNSNATFTLTLVSSYLTQMLINGTNIYTEVEYEAFRTSTEPIVVDLTSYTGNDIRIEFSANIVKYNTYFATANEYSIKFENSHEIMVDNENTNVNMRNYISTLQGEEIKFRINFDNYSALDKITLLSLDEVELATELKVVEKDDETYYSFTPTEHTIIVVTTKNKEFTIKVNYTEGGKIFSNIESDDVNNNSFSFKVNYDESFTLYVETNTGYKLSKVVRTMNANQNSLSVSNSYTITNVNTNMEIAFTFAKQTTWLSVDKDNNPINFKLTQLKGQGTAQKPYLISNIKEFLTMAYNVNILNESYTGKIFKVTYKDLTFDFSQYNFMPIGTNTTTFDGTILGNNLTLKGITIENGTNVGVFSELGTNALIKSINVLGNVKAHNLVASLVGTNNGTILGCSSSVTVLGINERAGENNIVSGICAINNGTISQTSFSGSVSGTANVMAGLCGINNGEILNVYNKAKVDLTNNNLAENIYVSGLVGQNKGTLKFGYNASKVNATGNNVILNGVTSNMGTISDVYYNSSVLTAEEDIGLTSSELKNETNQIYQTWDFETIWYFDEQSYDFPNLQTLYEFSGTINFKANFDNSISTKVLFVTLTNAYGESFDIVLNATKLTVSISDLSEGTYTITLRTAYSISVNSETTAEIELNEANGKEYSVEIALTKTTNSGYCSSILI